MGKERKIKCCELTIKFLRHCLIFPEEGKENSNEYNFKVFGLFFAVFLFWFSCGLHCANAIKNHYDIAVYNFDIVVCTSALGIMWILGCFYKYRNVFIELVRSISDFELFGRPPGYDEFNEKLNAYAKIHLIYVVSGALGYFTIFAPLHILDCKKLNIEKNLTEPCLLFSPMYIPYGQELLSTSSVVYILAACQFFIYMVIYTAGGSILWLNIECVEQIVFRIEHLKCRLLIALEEEDQGKRGALFRQAIRYHTEVLRMGELADKVLGTELCLHVILTGAILGVCAFVMISTHTLDTLMLFVGWLNAVIMGCVSGQRLLNESLTIPDVLNEVKWQNFETTLKKDIVFFLLRCKNPMRIRAANVIMTNHLIIEILHTAYSFLTLLSSVN